MSSGVHLGLLVTGLRIYCLFRGTQPWMGQALFISGIVSSSDWH